MGTYRCGKCKKRFYFNEALSIEEYAKMKSSDENSLPDIKNIGDLNNINRPKVCPHCGASFSVVNYELPNHGGFDKKKLIINLVVVAILYFPLFFLFGVPIFGIFRSWPFAEVFTLATILLMDLVIVLMMNQPVNYRVRY